MLPVLSNEIAVSRSVRTILDGSGSPRDYIASKLRGSTISMIAVALLHFLLRKLFCSTTSGIILLWAGLREGLRLPFLFEGDVRFDEALVVTELTASSTIMLPFWP